MTPLCPGPRFPISTSLRITLYESIIPGTDLGNEELLYLDLLAGGARHQFADSLVL